MEHVINGITVVLPEFSIWTGTKKLHRGEVKADLPPEELINLGTKYIFDKQRLRVFHNIKQSAKTCCDNVGVRFLSGWAVADEETENLVNSLKNYQDDFKQELDRLVSNYDKALSEYKQKNPVWAHLVEPHALSKSDVEKRFRAELHIYKVNAPNVSDENFQADINGLGDQLYHEISGESQQWLDKTLLCRDIVSQKALKPLQRIYRKMSSLQFIDGRVVNTLKSIEDVFSTTPKSGFISGSHLEKLIWLANYLVDAPRNMRSRSIANQNEQLTLHDEPETDFQSENQEEEISSDLLVPSSNEVTTNIGYF
ncbi:MAG: DUF3150 domain-containing protein [Gammaproteobacteria bacterium]|nr:DUF3150 domain-containing protein [Gammaproteobacteria bacterium]